MRSDPTAAIAGMALLAISHAFATAPSLANALGAVANAAPPGVVGVTEPGEELPGGAATADSPAPEGAFSQPSTNIGFEGGLDFKIGRAVFRKTWLAAPAATRLSDGLGPLYNARSCHGCHVRDGRGRPPTPDLPGNADGALVVHLSVPPRTASERRLLAGGLMPPIGDPVYGHQLQERAIEGHRREGRLRLDYETQSVKLADGAIVDLRKPVYAIADLEYGPLHAEAVLSPRVAPPMIGLGLLEAIPERALLAIADPEDEDGDGISGRLSRVWSLFSGSPAIGRFGWKAGAASVLEQSALAFTRDIGISNWLIPQPSGDCTASQQACLRSPGGSSDDDDEVSRRLLSAVARYARNLAVPKRRVHQTHAIIEGKKLFTSIGCAKCHVPSHVTGENREEPHLSGQQIWPYTDLLLHDMGDGLADGLAEGAGDAREWRTAPLWGIGLTQVVSGHTYFLHDGRARNLTEAILWHGGEAQKARDGFAALPRTERDTLLAFLNSL